MRTAFVEQLCLEAQKNPNIWLVCGDLGYSVLEQFSKCFPDRYLNAGVAEQNMTGVAAGLALRGKKVFTYSIANFPIMRCLEQIRNDVCYHNLDVKIVAVGGGLAYGSHGYTHHGVEDLAVMGALPGISLFAPGDPLEAKAVAQHLADTTGPAYVRLGKAGEPILHATPINFVAGRAIKLREGRDLTVFTTGGMLASAMAALEKSDLSVRLMSMPTVKPIDEAAILSAATETGGILTVEEHGPGGLGTRVAEVLATAGLGVRFFPVRLLPEPIKTSGTQEDLRGAQGLSVLGIVDAMKRLLSR